MLHDPMSRLSLRSGRRHLCAGLLRRFLAAPVLPQAASRCRRGWGARRIKQVGNGRHKLRRRKGLGQQNTIREAPGWPILAMRPGHIDDGERWVDLSGAPGHLPAVDRPEQIDVGHDSPIYGLIRLKKRNGFFARPCDH